MPFELLADWLQDQAGLTAVSVKKLTCDSRQVCQGDLFFAIKGPDSDGHDFVQQAVASGAVAVVCQKKLTDVAVPQIVVSNSAAEFARAVFALAVPEHQILTTGVTGTNGKTTTTWMLHSILKAADINAGLMGTVETFDGRVHHPSSMTTADPVALADHYSLLLQNQCRHNVMEVSSHALAQSRCAAIRFSAAAITNVTHDHLDYHGTLQEYRRAKMLIADRLLAGAPLILNHDDEGCRTIAKQLSHVECGHFSIQDSSAPFYAEVVSRTDQSQHLRLRLDGSHAELHLEQIGQHNVENALAAAALAFSIGLSVEAIINGLQQLKAVPGRLETINEGQPFLVLVDYAHTADALERCLKAVREFVTGRVICLFGAGGDRDRKKRPLMGRAADLADQVILTSDNPRSEDPSEIIREIRSGMSASTSCDEIIDRRDAIEFGCQIAQPGDVLLIAGKGHENRQYVNGESYEFDDRTVVRSILKSNSQATDES